MLDKQTAVGRSSLNVILTYLRGLENNIRRK